MFIAKNKIKSIQNLSEISKINTKISVIIPAYNSEKTIESCLNSVIHQNYKNYEIIVVDNNSTDITKKIIKDFQKRYGKIQYLFEKKIGRANARNAGIRIARGEIIAMIDSDCIAPIDWIEKIIEPIIKEDEFVVMGFEEAAFNNYWTRNIQESNWQFIKNKLDGNYVESLDTKNCAIKADLMKRMMFDPEIGNMEDFELYFRLKNIVKIRFLKNIKIKHHHKNTFFSWAKLQFNRGYWTAKIFKKYRDKENLKKEPMFDSFYLRNNLRILIKLLRCLDKLHFRNFLFLLVSGIFWRLGNIYGHIKF